MKYFFMTVFSLIFIVLVMALLNGFDRTTYGLILILFIILLLGSIVAFWFAFGNNSKK